MAKKTKKATPNGEPLAETSETKIMRLEAANLNLKLLALNQQRTALERQAQELVAQFEKLYIKLKSARHVPAGHEVNLETGEVFERPKQAS